MKVLVINNNTNEEIQYNGVQSHIKGLRREDGKEVFQLLFTDGSTATFNTKEFDCFMLKQIY